MKICLPDLGEMNQFDSYDSYDFEPGCNRSLGIPPPQKKNKTLRLIGISWGVKTTCLEAPGVSLGGSGVSIAWVGSLREHTYFVEGSIY